MDYAVTEELAKNDLLLASEALLGIGVVRLEDLDLLDDEMVQDLDLLPQVQEKLVAYLARRKPAKSAPLKTSSSNAAHSPLQTIRAELAVRGYVIHRPIGKGGQGSIFLAERCNTSGDRVVVKLWTERSNQEMFRREIENLKIMKHANIVGFQDSMILSDGSIALVMDFVEGLNLRQLLDSRGRLKWLTDDRSDGLSASEVMHGLLRAFWFTGMSSPATL